MNDTCMKLVARMILSTMTGKHKQTRDLYEKYLRERYLYVPIREILEAKETA